MNYKLFFIISAIIIIAVTITITAVRPELHKSLLIYNSDYVIKTQNTITIEEKTLPTIAQEPVIETKTTTPKVVQEKVIKTVPQVSQTKIIQKNYTQPKVASTKTTVTAPVKKQETKTENKVVKQTKKIEETPKEKIDKIIEENVPIPPVILTQQEEEIQWNKWRSKLQNQIMADVKLPVVPQGTVFKFTFNVDKYGRVSEVQTWSTNPAYTPYAIQYIAPVIRSYQGKAILNFPDGSNRITTTVQGGWKISLNEKYSTPQDYHDIEKVVR